MNTARMDGSDKLQVGGALALLIYNVWRYRGKRGSGYWKIVWDRSLEFC
ncbi:MAG: hypothetical protein HFI11_06320 [Lachnospiraceae bacterium]|nr:hypothetical protein [Lachnospiraceae bacterium]